MRVFRIQQDGTFVEYMQTPFAEQHEESVLQEWLESNSDSILDSSGVLIIGREVSTNLDGYIDLLGLDRQGNVVVVELKRDRTPRDVIAQALEYVSFAASLEPQQLETRFRKYQQCETLSLSESHRQHFALGQEVSFNKDQRVVIVGRHITPGIRQTAEFLNAKGARVTCIEFTFFQSSAKDLLMSLQIVVSDQNQRPPGAISAPRRVISKDEFLAACDEFGKHVFARILTFAEEGTLKIQWAATSFFLKVSLGGTLVPVCYCFSHDAGFGQTVYTGFYGAGGAAGKIANPEGLVQSLKTQATDTGLFVSAGKDDKDLKIPITRRLKDDEISSLQAWCETAEKMIREYGLV